MSALPPPLAPQLSPENLVQLANARASLGKVRRAISIGNFDAWTIAIFAAFTLLFGFTSWSSLLLGLAMGAAAAIEIRGVNRLRRLEPGAARMLGINQLALAAVLLIYAAWRIHKILGGESTAETLGASDVEIAQGLEEVASITRSLGLAVYGALIAVAVFGQGGLAWYYFTRGKLIEAYIAQTPEWIVAMQRAGVGF